MSESNLTAKRYEKKYLLSKGQYLELKERLKDHVINDKYGNKTICNIYYDTPQFLLIRRSIEKPIYKEKFRIRSYDVPTKEDNVFVEIKKKYKGVVYKRRISMKLDDAMAFVNGDRTIYGLDKDQVANEISWFLDYYDEISPRMFIAYDREALFAKNDPSLRITFDSNILYRTDDLKLETGAFGEHVLEPDKYIMELKTTTAIPLWLCQLLDELKIYPASFSKYGTAYKYHVQNRKDNEVKEYA